MRWLAALALLFQAHLAFAQNCESVKSGLDADRRPQNAGRDIVGQNLDEIQERGWILFAVYADFAPYSWEKDGKLAGVDVDVGRLIADRLGVEARFHATFAADNVDGDLLNNVWKGSLLGGPVANVMLHVPYNRELACRNEQVVLNGQYFNERIAIAYRRDRYPNGGPQPAYFRYDTVGVENDSLSDFYLASIANGQLVPNMTRFASTDEAMAALRADKVMAVMGPLAQLEYGAGEDVAIHMPPLPGLANASWTLGVAVRHNWRQLSYAVDDAIRAAVEDGSMKRIFEEHGLTYTPPQW